MKRSRIIAWLLFCSLIFINLACEQSPPETEGEQRVGQPSEGDDFVQQYLQREKSNLQPNNTRQKSFGQSGTSPLHAPTSCQEAGFLTKDECSHCDGLPGMVCQANVTAAGGAQCFECVE